MSDITRETIQQRLDATRANLAAFIESANQQIAAANGAIAMLEQLLADTADSAAPVEATQEQAD